MGGGGRAGGLPVSKKHWADYKKGAGAAHRADQRGAGNLSAKGYGTEHKAMRSLEGLPKTGRKVPGVSGGKDGLGEEGKPETSKEE